MNRYVGWLLRAEPGQLYLNYCKHDPWMKLKLLLNDKKFTEALTEAETFYSVAKKQNEHSQLLKIYEQEDKILIENGLRKFHSSLSYCNKSVELKIDLFGKDSLETTYGINALGFVLFQLQKFKDSKIYVDAGVSFNLALKGPDNIELAIAYNNIAFLAASDGDFEGSLLNHHHALKIKREIFSPVHSEICITYNNIASVYIKMKKINEAIQYYQMALEIWLQLPPFPSKDIAITMTGLANVYSSLQNHEASSVFGHLAYHLRYLFLENTFGDKTSNTSNSQIQVNEEQAMAMDNISSSFSKLDRKKEALEFSKRSNFIWVELLKKTTNFALSLINNVNQMAALYQNLDMLPESFDEMNKLSAHFQQFPPSLNAKESFFNNFRQNKINISNRIIQWISDSYNSIAINMHDKALISLSKVVNILDQIIESKIKLKQIQEPHPNRFLIHPQFPKQDKFNDNINKILPYIAFESRDGFLKPRIITLPRRCIQKSDQAETKETNISSKIQEINQKLVKKNQNTNLDQRINATNNAAKDSYQTNNSEVDYSFLIQNNQESASLSKGEYPDFSCNQLLVTLLILSIAKLYFEGVVQYDIEFSKFARDIFRRLRQIATEHIGSIGRDIALKEIDPYFKNVFEMGGIQK